MNKEKLVPLTRDLRKDYPRSPRAMVGGYVIVARCLDKCRSFLMEINGEYNFWPCMLCAQFEAFTGIGHEAFKEFAASGASDDEMGEWIKAESKVKSEMEIIRWNNKMRDMRIGEMSDDDQKFFEIYIQENLPKDKPVYVWFDVYDIEEKRL